MATELPVGAPVLVESVNINEGDRFVAALVSSYGNDRDKITTVQEAAAAALALVFDSQSDGTMWSVYDRETGKTSTMSQDEFEELALKPGFIE